MIAKPIGKKSFAEHAQVGKNLLYGINYKNDRGELLYFYVLIDRLKEKNFLRAMSGSEVFDMREFGKIVSAGYGEPSDTVKQELRDLYNAKI